MQRFDFFKIFLSKKFFLTIHLFLFLLSKVNSSSPEISNENISKENLSKRKSEETIFDYFSDNLAENIGLIFNATLFIFLLLSLYLMCAICKLRKEEEELFKPQVYKFIYLTNNGYIVVSLGLYFFVGNEKVPFFLIFLNF